MLAAGVTHSILSSRPWTLVTRAPSSPDKPRVGITIGDPAGIGPEIVLKAVADDDVRAFCKPVIIGAAAELRRQADALGLNAAFPTYSEEHSGPREFDKPVILDTDNLNEKIEWGALSAASGRAAIAAIEACVRLCLRSDFIELWLLRLLMTIRSGKRLPPGPVPSDLRQRLQGTGFVLLAAAAGEELVLGIAGRFWRPVADAAPTSPPTILLGFLAPDTQR